VACVALVGACVITNQRHRVDIVKERGSAALDGRLRVSKCALPNRHRQDLRWIGVLLQQMPNIGRGLTASGDRQQHRSLFPTPSCQIKPGILKGIAASFPAVNEKSRPWCETSLPVRPMPSARVVA
jgi:hypothetical protein